MPDPVDRPLLAAANVVALVGWGVLLSFWMLYYTDWFPVFGGLLGLTGAFSWVAFLTNVVPKHRKEAFAGWFDRQVLQRLWPIGVLSAISLAFVAFFTTWHGTLVIDTLGDSVPRTVELVRADGDYDSLRLGAAARAESKRLLPTAPFAATAYQIKLAGLPAFLTEISPWQRTTIVLPADALVAPVALLRPTASMSGEASSGEFALVVQADGAEYGRLTDYRGESVWIGAASDVEVPLSLIDRWRLELISQELPTALVQRWTAPLSIIGEQRLTEGMEITAMILREPDNPDLASAGLQGQATAPLQPPRGSADFPQEVVIDVRF